MIDMNALLRRVKANLIVTHNADDALLLSIIKSAVSYAERYQKKPDSFYYKRGKHMTASTEQAIVMLASFWYESRDSSDGGFFGASPAAAQNVITAVERLLSLDKDWIV